MRYEYNCLHFFVVETTEPMLLTGRFNKHVRNVGRIIHRQPDTDQNVNGRNATNGNVPVKHKPDQIHHGQHNRQNDPRCNAPMWNQTRNHHTDHGPTDRQIAGQFFVDDAHFFPVQEFKRIRKRFGPSVVFHHFGQFFAHGGLQDMIEKKHQSTKTVEILPSVNFFITTYFEEDHHGKKKEERDWKKDCTC